MVLTTTGLTLFDRLPLELRRQIYQYYILACHDQHLESSSIVFEMNKMVIPNELAEVSSQLANEIDETIRQINAHFLFIIQDPLITLGLPIMASFGLGSLMRGPLQKLCIRLPLTSFGYNRGPIPWYSSDIRYFRQGFQHLKLLYLRNTFDFPMPRQLTHYGIEHAAADLRAYLAPFSDVESVRFQFSAKFYGTGEEFAAEILNIVANTLGQNFVVVADDGTNGDNRMLF